MSLEELATVRRMIDILLLRQTLLSDVMLPSEESLCPICYAKSISATFEPCHHQSCNDCIIQHLMNHKVCFYCKTYITCVRNNKGISIFENTVIMPAVDSETSTNIILNAGDL